MYLVYQLIAESAAAQSNEVYSTIACGFFACDNEWRNVETETAASLNHHSSAYAAELVAEHCGRDYGTVVNNHLACKLGAVAYDTSVAYLTVVGNMHILHQQIAVSNHSLSLARRAAAHCDILAYAVVVADDAESVLTAILQVLRLCAYACAWKKLVAVAYSCSIVHGDAVGERVVVANHHVLVDTAKRTNNVAVADFCLWMHKCQITYVVHNEKSYLFLTICPVNVASATSWSPTNIQPFIVEIP